jgi:hypothetical protein
MVGLTPSGVIEGLQITPFLPPFPSEIETENPSPEPIPLLPRGAIFRQGSRGTAKYILQLFILRRCQAPVYNAEILELSELYLGYNAKNFHLQSVACKT